MTVNDLLEVTDPTDIDCVLEDGRYKYRGVFEGNNWIDPYKEREIKSIFTTCEGIGVEV